MKLELKGHSIMLFASLILLAGCKQKSGMDILTAQMSGLTALKSQYVVHRDGEKDVLVNVLYSKPNRILITSEDFVVALNETDGHFESIFSEKIYDTMPWDGKVYPGTGKVVPTALLSAGPATGKPPMNIVPEVPWKLETKTGNIERYKKVVTSLDGPQTYILEVTDKGVPVKFIDPQENNYIVKSFEQVGEIPLEKFRVQPKEGFVSHRASSDLIMLETGRQFSWTKFKAASDVSQFKLEGNTLFAFVDPNEPTSLNAMKWIMNSGQGYKKVTISKGNASTGFFDPTGVEINKLTTTTPMFVMVNKESKIIGMWLGFDPENIVEFETDIQTLIGKGR